MSLDKGQDRQMRVPVAYDPAWPITFDGYRQDLEQATGQTCIYHIGSTAVPGLAAKPIIDIQLGVASLDTFDTDLLADAGFEFEPRITRDDAPAHHPQTPALWRKLYARRHQNGLRTAHLHIRQVDLPNFRLALMVRDFLRADPVAANHYAAFKIQAAKAGAPASDPGGTGAYLDLKDPFVALLILLAEAWARDTNWPLPDP